MELTPEINPAPRYAPLAYIVPYPVFEADAAEVARALAADTAPLFLEDIPLMNCNANLLPDALNVDALPVMDFCIELTMLVAADVTAPELDLIPLDNAFVSLVPALVILLVPLLNAEAT